MTSLNWYGKKNAVACVGLASVLYKKTKKDEDGPKSGYLNESNTVVKFLRKLKTNKRDDFKNYLRMGPNTSDELLKLIGLIYSKTRHYSKEHIPPEERFIVTLRFLATGRSYECTDNSP